jgi:hypothetical protein
MLMNRVASQDDEAIATVELHAGDKIIKDLKVSVPKK